MVRRSPGPELAAALARRVAAPARRSGTHGALLGAALSSRVPFWRVRTRLLVATPPPGPRRAGGDGTLRYDRQELATGLSQEGPMQIEVKGRGVPVTDDLRESVERRFERVARQVSDLAVLQIEFSMERNPANPVSNIAEATLHLKGATLRAVERSRDQQHARKLVSEDMARQVKRHRDKRRGPRAGSGSDLAASNGADPSEPSIEAFQP